MNVWSIKMHSMYRIYFFKGCSLGCTDVTLSRARGKKGGLKELNSYMSGFPNRHACNKIIYQTVQLYSRPRPGTFCPSLCLHTVLISLPGLQT